MKLSEIKDFIENSNLFSYSDHQNGIISYMSELISYQCISSITIDKDNCLTHLWKESPYKSFIWRSSKLEDLTKFNLIEMLDKPFLSYPEIIKNDKEFSIFEKSNWSRYQEKYIDWRKVEKRELFINNIIYHDVT